MKLETARIDAFLKKPSAGIVLLYGPDTGLAASRAQALARAILGPDLNDPFRQAELSAPDLGTFLAEATAASLLGGRRVLRVRDAGEALAKPVETLLATPPDALIILEAGDLTPRSKLRALAEKHPAAAVISCYGIDLARLPRVITERLAAAGKAIDPDAAAWTARNIAPDESAVAQAVELLTLYAGPASKLTLADVTAALPDGGETSIQDAVDATLTGDTAALDRALTLAYAESVSPVAILRVLLSELMRLRLAAASGLPAAAAVAAMRPPVFFKRTASMTRALNMWTAPALANAIRTALAAEAACKSTHIPDQPYCRQTLFALTTKTKSK